MASYGQAVPPGASPRPVPYGAAYGAPLAMAPPGAPAGTFSPGTKIQVGSHRVVIQKYLSEGGFAHVYLVKLPSAVNGTDQAVLKRVAVPDKESLRGMRTEVETMKRLKGHKAIVTYMDSHASELRGGGYEVFLLMEYCNGGGLIDFMNTRLQHRLTEPEILNIFADVAEGVACMHYLKPPLLHRDLKVENVLITTSASSRKFKLCDFGSAAPPRPAPTTVVECRLMDEDVQKHTTMQYRSPEMIDVYRKQPIDEKSDIWALGVLLYKLCYYTTPFEDQGQLAILNASYKFPAYPVFSDRLKKLIAWMLRENQQARPNIYQALREACVMLGKETPVKDIYAGTSEGDALLSSPEQNVKSPPVVGAIFSPPAPKQQAVPEVERMRRGRVPVASSQPTAPPPKPSPSPNIVTNGDPFAALDARPTVTDGDELSSRFPTLDQFSLLHDHGTKFDFDSAFAPQPQLAPPPKDLSQRVAERLADEAFQVKPSPSPAPPQAIQRRSVELNRTNPYSAASPDTKQASPPLQPAAAPPKKAEMSRASAIISNIPELKAISSQASQPTYQSTPSRPTMVSTGTMTSTPPPERQTPQFQQYRFPPTERDREPGVSRQQDAGAQPLVRGEAPNPSRPGAIPSRSSLFQGQPNQPHVRHPSSSRPSLEGGRPSFDLLEPISKSKSQGAARPRPVSTHLESNIDYLREREGSKPLPSPGLPSPRYSIEKDLPPSPDPEDEMNIESNVEFLRSMEDSDPRKKDKSHKHGKRSSLTSLGAGTKSILAGKFGDAFKRFEGSSSGPPPPRTPSPLKDLERRELTPIAGSEATDGRSDDGQMRDGEDLTPEMRREQESRMLAQEEARVAAAQAEYRQRVAQRDQGGSSPGPGALPKSIGGVSRAVSIQNKVQSLLGETTRSSTTVARTAQGYGRYADAALAARPPSGNDGRPLIARKPITGPQPGEPALPRGSYDGGGGVQRAPTAPVGNTNTMEPAGRVMSMGTGRPTAPPKPTHLNKNSTASAMLPPTGGRPGSPPKPSVPSNSNNINVQRLRPAGGPSGVLVAVELPGQPALQMTAAEKDNYIHDFQKRFPSLTSIEMVERDLGAEAAAAGESGRPAR
ncbi:hypothetical protein B0T26DRAFT_640753 [Lasiosphaeria miniovina]|uniref:non-specific serine/threonine protein kinase n=1 Tax=Lasiosphaeria miniovina TaxID=1954250 RepID=A0AA40AVR7_9PEZI|nr:uncharacterized protein B0T26DRAFT_640753 [Lasiosphaeria miniovina]KAK0722866.1 hypothetical protein B0T26DRAFT_640753 [Lasiosphaeria miniovina]